jgi:hypothetical protein
MKKIIFACILGLLSTYTFAQKNNVSGTVNDEQGKPVPFAFIKDAKHNYATFTDMNGGFNIKLDTADRLIVSARNFKGMVVKITPAQNVNIVMKADGSTTKAVNTDDIFTEKISTEGMSRNAATGYIAKESSVHGSRYFFANGVHGYVITTADSIKQDDSHLYNYQKMEGSLLFTDDGKTMKEIDRRLIKMFVLFDDQGSYVFENAPVIDSKHFVQVLATGSNYKIYKLLATTFFPNDYVSNGMTSSGNNYDEIKDVPVYYAVKLPGGTPQKFTLRSKALKAVFAADAVKVNKYLSGHDSDIDDAYIKNLGDYLNNQ